MSGSLTCPTFSYRLQKILLYTEKRGTVPSSIQKCKVHHLACRLNSGEVVLWFWGLTDRGTRMDHQESNQMEGCSGPVQCRNGCGFYAGSGTEGLCSVCYKDAIKKKQQPPTVSEIVCHSFWQFWNELEWMLDNFTTQFSESNNEFKLMIHFFRACQLP